MKTNPLAPVMKAVGGATAAALVGNGTLLTMPPAAMEAMPWWGFMAYNVVFVAVGYLVPYFFPANKPAQ